MWLSNSPIPSSFCAQCSSMLTEQHKCIKLNYCMNAFCRVHVFSHTALNTENGTELPCIAEKETNNGFPNGFAKKQCFAQFVFILQVRICKWWCGGWNVMQTTVGI